MENNAKKRSLPAWVILAIIALVAGLALAVTNSVTSGPIAEHKQQALAEAFTAVLPAESYEELDVPAAYGAVDNLAVARDAGGAVLGTCVKASAQGYGGPVAVILGVDNSGTVTAAQIGDTDFSETDGFGARWQQEANTARLVGLNAVDGGAFEALSGATRTSNAVLSATNSALNCVAETVFSTQGGGITFGTPAAAAAASA